MSRRLAVAVLALSLAFTMLSGATWGAANGPQVVLVGYDPDEAKEAHLAIQASGGSVRRSSPELGFAVVETADPARFRQVVTLTGAIDYVESNDATRLDGAQWNGAQWNGAQWNGAQWNGAQWNGAQWNTMRDQGAQWNGAQWNGAQWNAAQATMKYAPPRWSHDAGTTDPGLVWQWGTWATDIPRAWTTTMGSLQAKLCVVDSGVAWDHPDLAPNMWTGALGEHGWNAIDPTATAYDDAGHGTHIAGIAAAATGNAFGIAGVANVQIMAAKVLDGEGRGTESDLAFGLVWCANQGADVIVMALSASEADHPTLDRALQYAADRDALMLASAGNDGADKVSFPARDPRVIGVGAVGTDLRPAPFSNRGPEVDVTAPGVDILGTFPGGAFAFGSGTSQAVAYAAGMAGLVRDTDPPLTGTQARAILLSTATDIGESGPDAATGHGLLNAPLAVDAALA